MQSSSPNPHHLRFSLLHFTLLIPMALSPPHNINSRLLQCSSSFFFYHSLFFSSVHSFFFFFLSLLPVQSATLLGNETDRLASLAFKHQITADPNDALSSWNDSLHFCQWKGVTCAHRHRQRVIGLDLAHQQLVGPTSPSIANLSFLRKIRLQNNSFYGHLPRSVFHLPRLRSVNLSYNSYHGEIPANMTTQLQVLDLRDTELVGVIPGDLQSLSSLTWLNLRHNKLRGSIPPSLGNLSSLTHLDLGENSLKGSIPYDIGRLVKLKYLNLGINTLSGTIPSHIYNLSSLAIFSVTDNRLYGSLPPHLGTTLPNLQDLYLGGNRFRGPMPSSLPNASRLAILDFDGNSFTGIMPLNLGSLQGLSILSLGGNQLGGMKEAKDMTFLNSLINCTSLSVLDLGFNNFKGALPNAMANFSTQLTYLNLGDNQIFGTIPRGVENLIGLNMLAMGANFIEGTIPVGIGKLNKLNSLYLAGNRLQGQIPTSLGNLTRLSLLSLGSNNLTGKIPSSLGNCRNMQQLDLNDNKLSGNIPEQVLNIPALSIYLDLSHNSFSGSLFSEVGSLKMLGTLDMSYNNLSGEIPSTLSNCLSMEYLFMQHNSFQGTIPSSLSSLKGIRLLNLSFNDLVGEVPKDGIFRNASAVSVYGNSRLCGGISELQLPTCPTRIYTKHGRSRALKVGMATFTAVFCLIITALFIIAFQWRKKLKKKPTSTCFVDHQLLRVSYLDLHRATNGFSLENLIGVGSYSSVYKGTLEIYREIIAVKVLNLQQHGAFGSFNAECESLRNARHRNLVQIITCCSSIDFSGNDFKALVFEYMPKGSLEKWLQPDEGEQHLVRKLTFVERVNIATDVASSLHYLHHHGKVPIVHRDLKPSNILFDDDLNAHVGDFGLAKLIFEAIDNCSKDETSSSRIKGTIGYVAPEYGMGCKASTQGDVYSYGILLLEIFTGKRPTDDMFKDGLDLYQFTKMALPDQVMKIADPQLLEDVEASSRSNNNGHSVNMRNKLQDCLIMVFKVGIACCVESPKERMEMGDVVGEMIAIKDLYLGTRVNY